jgi:transketolase
MKKDKNVILLTCDTGAMLFKDIQNECPEQFYNVGIAEQNAISVASGLALSGKKVFVFGISNFVILRCYEQIKCDICTMNLPVTILAMGAGYGYSSDGPTHHMIEDFSIARTLPNITLWNISDNKLASHAIEQAYSSNKPNIIRFDKGPYAEIYNNNTSYPHNNDGGFCYVKHGRDTLIISTGIMTTQALQISEELEKENIKIGVIDLYRFQIDDSIVVGVMSMYKNIITLEENCKVGGISELISKIIVINKIKVNFESLGLNNVCRIEVGDREFMRSLDGLDKENIKKIIKA